MSYQEIFYLLKSYSRLSKGEREIIELLFEHDILDCTYSSLANTLDCDISNVRKSLLHLEKLGVIYIVKNKTHKRFKPMVGCFLVDGWMEYLLKNA